MTITDGLLDSTLMKRRLSQTQVDRVREEYDRWDKFGAGSETAEELARRLGISKATLYRLRDRHWRVDSARDGVPAASRDDVPAAISQASSNDSDVVQWLAGELIAARQKIAALEVELEIERTRKGRRH